MSALDLDRLLEERQILVVAGTGGVGKTTIAAALAVEAARRRRHVMVLTIDPARRLYDALGLEHADPAAPSNTQTLPVRSQRRLGIAEPGRLDAQMLDMKSTFDGLVERFADGPETRSRILENPIYQHLSARLAGSAEYAAMEKVFELAESGAYDLIVIDTPPSQHALDFLEAPRRLIDFFDNSLVQRLVHPAMAAGRFGFRLFQRTSQRVLGALERISGVGFLQDITEFLLAIEGMSAGFRKRATRVRELLMSSDCAFLLVAGPHPEAARPGHDFLVHMRTAGIPVEGILLNRMRLWPDGEVPTRLLHGEVEAADLQALADLLASGGDGLASGVAEQAAHSAVEATKRYASLVQLDQQSTAPLREEAERSGRIVACIPEFPRDIGDADGLLRLGDLLFRNPLPGGPRSKTGPRHAS